MINVILYYDNPALIIKHFWSDELMLRRNVFGLYILNYD